MKKYIISRSLLILFVAFFGLISCNNESKSIQGDVVNIPNTADGNADMESLPVISFAKTDHDFGKVIRGETVSYSFKFKNTGEGILLISNVSASCGCTATEYPKDPIKPGEESVIEVTFDSGNRKGFQHKTVTIGANTQPNTSTLSIKAVVISPELN